MNEQEKRKVEDKIVKDQKEAICSLLDGVYKACEVTAKEFDSENIPLRHVKSIIESTKTSFRKGARRKPTKRR
jgi:hypothetical protein